MLKSYYSKEGIEAGVDECGRGCLCGPVVAGAVILPKDFTHPYINDSKKLSKSKMLKLELEIKAAAIDWNIALIHHEEIDEINIHHASIKAMHEALNGLKNPFDHILVDGKFFKNYEEKTHTCVIKGDGEYLSIASAAILAKCFRDNYMAEMSIKYPGYGWETNAGYGTVVHREGLKKLGITPIHRKSFNLGL